MTNWDDAFDNINHVPNAHGYFDMWADRAQAFRQSNISSDLNVSYGTDSRQKMDIFYPKGQPKGIVVFIHGGYWIRLDHSYFSDLASGPLANGWVVAIPSYTLAPDALISQITVEIAKAITHIATIKNGPIRLVGHSAGGHLVTRMVCKNSPLNAFIQHRIEKVVSISGLHDLRNLRKTKLNKILQLSDKEAKSESSCLQLPVRGTDLICWIGSSERPEFINQSKMLHSVWSRISPTLNITTDLVLDHGKHHFDVIDALKDQSSRMTQALIG